jgi:hypothetical protein
MIMVGIRETALETTEAVLAKLSAIESIAFRIPPPCREVPEIVGVIISARALLFAHAAFLGKLADAAPTTPQPILYGAPKQEEA